MPGFAKRVTNPKRVGIVPSTFTQLKKSELTSVRGSAIFREWGTLGSLFGWRPQLVCA